MNKVKRTKPIALRLHDDLNINEAVHIVKHITRYKFNIIKVLYFLKNVCYTFCTNCQLNIFVKS